MPAHAQRSPPPVVAAIDLGTNNCRLLIARAPTPGEITVVDSFSRIVRLGEGVGQTGALSETAIERTVAALKICASQMRAAKVTHVRAIATEACRRATNADVLLRRAKAETGIDLVIVTPEEEARLAAVGCAPLIGADYKGALIFDIGGGSTEVIWMQRNGTDVETLLARSLPVGVVTLSEEKGCATDRAGFEAMCAAMIPAFRRVRAEMDGIRGFVPGDNHLLGTSGTVTTLAGIALGLARYSRSRVDASWHDSAAILSVVDRLVALDLKARRAVGCVGMDRADLIVPGCAIFAAIHSLWPCPRLRVADRGLREGMLRELAAEAHS